MTTSRLNKFISQSGHCSRRKADELIAGGKVRVNGKVITEMGTKVDEGKDEVKIIGGPTIKPSHTTVLIALHKPPRYVCTKSDPHNEKTIYNLLPKQLHTLFTIGRLDKDSEGLLLLTNNGELANMYAHPRHKKVKTYMVECKGQPSEKGIERMERGMHLKEFKTLPAQVVIRAYNKQTQRTTLEVKVKEGKKRQIRMMFLAIGCPVKKLVRIGFGPYKLGQLKRGEWRELNAHYKLN